MGDGDADCIAGFVMKQVNNNSKFSVNLVVS